MIPLKLQLKNFLSYGESPVTVDFAPHHLMCLSGKNGHGKSALLDAMTWAVWGQARKVGGVPRDDMRLMRLGQRHMLVIFDFACNQQHYRAKREMTISHDKAFSTLEFGMLDAETQNMVPLTDKTIRLTQQKIEATIGFTYESFTNSVFLRQGQSNEFSKKTARERKEVLSTILGLDRYERAREWILDQVRKDVDSQLASQRLCERLTAEIAREGDVRASLAGCQHQLATLAEQEQQLVTQQTELRMKREKITARVQQAQAVQAGLVAVQEQVRSYVLSRQLVGAQQRSELEVQLATVQQQQRAATDKQQAFAGRLQVLEREQAQAQNVLKQLATHEHEQVQTEVRFQAAQRLWEKRKALYHKMVGYAHWVNRELADTTQRQQRADDGAQPTCPLCEQALGNERQQFLCAKLSHQQRFYEHRLRRVSQFLRVCKPQLDQEQQQLIVFTQQLQRRVQAQTQAGSVQERLSALQTEMTGIHHELAQVLAQVAPFVEQAHRLKKQLHECEQNIAQYLGSDVAYQALQEQVVQAEQQLAQLRADIKQDPDQQCVANEQALAQQQRALNQQRQALLQQQGGLERDMQLLAQMRAELKACQESLVGIDAQIAQQKMVAQAFGKDGIQALLIESIVPEIEAEANALLARLSDQNTQVFIESLRDLKKGGARETLDINIADTMGIRPYELFSGGEAFRIDFALRVAISKLLARRAGATLQTLIIDEGFGSQDEDGLALIMDVLYRVQADFAKIIIVSHLSSLKEQFPVHLVVEKGAQGSLVRVVEQG